MARLLILLCLFTSAAANAYAEFAIIVNPQSKFNQISARDLARIFLAKTKRLPDGAQARPAELASAESKSRFYFKIAGKREIELRQYWATMIFTGNGQPPKQLHSIENVIQYVIKNPGAIAYVTQESLDDSVKVLELID